MRYRFFYGAKPVFTQRDRQDFSRGKYECVDLMVTRRGSPVVISQSKDPLWPVWKVEYDYSCVFFGDYNKAMTFCNKRFRTSERRPTT